MRNTTNAWLKKRHTDSPFDCGGCGFRPQTVLDLDATFAWMAIFFFASAGASSAYLTVSEIFPLETRALAIAAFYAAGTACGGIIAPLLFSFLISKQSHWWLAGDRGRTDASRGLS